MEGHESDGDDGSIDSTNARMHSSRAASLNASEQLLNSSNIDEDEVVPRLHHLNKDCVPFDRNDILTYYSIPVKEKNIYDQLSRDDKEAMHRAIVRTVIFKGSRADNLTRGHLSDAVGKVDEKLKKGLSSGIRYSQVALFDTFGFGLASDKGNAILGSNAAESVHEKFYLFNALNSPALAEVIAELTPLSEVRNNAYKGFCFVVFHLLWTAPGKTLASDILHRELRKIDSRFPETETTSGGKRGKASSSEQAIPGFSDGGSISSLLTRMVKNGYLALVKSDSIAEKTRLNYELGPRYFVEIGHKALARSFYAGMETEVDPTIMRDIEVDIETRKAKVLATRNKNSKDAADEGANKPVPVDGASSSSASKSKDQEESGQAAARRARKARSQQKPRDDANDEEEEFDPDERPIAKRSK